MVCDGALRAPRRVLGALTAAVCGERPWLTVPGPQPADAMATTMQKIRGKAKTAHYSLLLVIRVSVYSP